MRGGYYPEFWKSQQHFRSDPLRQLLSRSFRVLVVTDLRSQDVPFEDVQYLDGHANPRTTQIYDHRRRRVTGMSWRGIPCRL